MEIKKHTNREIAESFSNGNFELTFPYLSEKVTWNIVGENLFLGKSDVMTNCRQTAEYFNSVQTDFKTEDIIVTDKKVVVRGTGEFLRNGVRVNFITACDVYEFNENNELELISSYCIADKN
ncbi:MAG: nuclear transport factor 2 family protein [Saprospiraceae bacterium]|nr:nuclear transport factor 2 family protein [Saprospiraceae bacterium]